MPPVERNLFRGKLVRLAAPSAADGEAFARWSQDPEYLRHLDTDFAQPFSGENWGDRERAPGGESRSFTFRLRSIKDDTLIGFVALHSIEWNNQSTLMAIGIGDPTYRGQGYGRDALQLILNYAFNELNLHRVGLDVNANNQVAIRAYESVGFRHEGAMRQALMRDGQRWDRLIMGILRPQWLETQQ
ncbi:MAG: N-acetyltransferase [Chloroflexi bacterium]|nr:N-acetyltransferase [Chloroflexota bacterium]